MPFKCDLQRYIVASGKASPKETKAVVFSDAVDGGTHYTFATVVGLCTLESS